jgi:hypothetical protein
MSGTGRTITLSQRAAELANKRAASLGFADVEEYLEALILDDDVEKDYGAPPHLQPKTREELEALVTEGLNTPSRPMTPDDWNQMKRELIARHNRRKR